MSKVFAHGFLFHTIYLALSSNSCIFDVENSNLNHRKTREILIT